MIQRGSVHWADLGVPRGSGPGNRRPVVVIQDDEYTTSRLATVLVAILTTNTALAAMPGNVFVPRQSCGLSRDSVINVTALVTIDREFLEQPVGLLPLQLVRQLDEGLRRVLHL